MLFFIHLLRRIPLSVNYRIADFFGYISYLFPHCKKIVTANLQVAFPEKTPSEIRKIAIKSLQNNVLSFIEFAWFGSDNRDRTIKYLSFSEKNDKFLKDKIAKKENFIYVTPHLGNWEIAGMMMQIFWSELPFAVIARTFPNPYVNNLLASGRTSFNNLIIPSKGAVKGMMKAIKNGYSMATLIDQNSKIRNGGIFVNFFGLPVPTSRAPAFFGRKLNIELAVGGCVRQNGKYIIFMETLPKKTSEYNSDEELIQALMDLTESIIRKYPDQYTWFYRRFQYIPQEASAGLAAKYPFYARKADKKFYSRATVSEES